MVAGDRLADRIGIGVLAAVFTPELVDRVVEQAGVREQRKRTLPARVVVYYLLAMVLFFNSSYAGGVEQAGRGPGLGKAVPGAPGTGDAALGGGGHLRAPAAGLAGDGGLAGGGGRPAGRGGAGVRVRVRGCGWWPWTGCAWTCRTRRRTGRSSATRAMTPAAGPFPQIRVVGLGECGTRAVLGAGMSPLATGEQPLTRQLLGKLQPGDLLLADRNFLSHGLLADVLAAGVHVLWRAKSDVDLPVLEVLPDGTWLSRIADPAASRRMRRRGADPKAIPGITVRVIEYTVTSEDGSETSETFTLITDILDPALLTCEQAAAAYACRWQLETCFDELETSIRGGAAVVLRSKSPPMIRQEIYAMLCCYQAIRTLISHAAGDAGLDPARISFTRARDAIRSRISDSGCFSP